MVGPTTGVSSIWRMRGLASMYPASVWSVVLRATIAGALTDQPLARAMQRLQIKLIGALGGNEPHGGRGDRLRIAEVVLLSFPVRANVFRRHQPSVVAKRSGSTVGPFR
jgi:hypothetical protein